MRIFIFESEAKPDLRAFGGDLAGSQLPSQFKPCRAVGAVAPGQEVKVGEPLAIVEAMKMENVLRAERDGRIARIRANPGDSLAVDQVILEFE